MSFLRGLFGEKENPLLKRAGTLVESANMLSIGTCTPLLERFPILQKVDMEQWDFVLTVAAVFMASTRLNNLKLEESREEKLMEIVADHLNQWKPNEIRGFEDCKALFEREFDRLRATGHEPQFVAADAVGIWIVWNVLGHSPQSNEECDLVRATGTLVTHSFFNWWNT